MKDQAKEDLIIFLLKVWWHLTESNTIWPSVKSFVEGKLNELLPHDPFKEECAGCACGSSCIGGASCISNS